MKKKNEINKKEKDKRNFQQKMRQNTRHKKHSKTKTKQHKFTNTMHKEQHTLIQKCIYYVAKFKKLTSLQSRFKIIQIQNGNKLGI